jgi:dynein heavy chain, axonemal
MLGLEHTASSLGPGRLDVQDEALSCLQVQFWERMRLPIPYIAMEIQAQREKYRVLIDKILAVVREYNHIIVSVAGERKLFTDRLRCIDRRVTSGINKLTWNMDKTGLDFYQKEAQRYCRDGTQSVATFKAGLATIRALCADVADLSLIDMHRKKVLDYSEFAEKQRLQHAAAVRTLEAVSSEITATKNAMYVVFASDGAEVQQQWLLFTERLDNEMLNSMRLAVKKSLSELNKAINGDKRTEVAPLFYTTLELERTLGATETVELKPTLQDLANMIRGVSRDLLQVCVGCCVHAIAVSVVLEQLPEQSCDVQSSQRPAVVT